MQALVVVLCLLIAVPAHASGPVERLMQVLFHPQQPSLWVVRYGAGAGSHGYLFSRDGGRSFQLMCSANVSPEKDTLATQRISTRPIPMTAVTTVDHHGAVIYAQYGATWIDDGTGCTWSEEAALHGTWPLGFVQDGPRIWSVVSTNALELWRRDQTWSSVGLIREVERDKAVLDASLVMKGRDLYASVLLMGARGVSAAYVLHSDDGGVTWAEHALPRDQERLSLLAVDPLDSQRLLAAIPRDGSADTLLLSRDGGASFQTYFEPRAVGGVTFDDGGRLYVGDIGDGAAPEVEGGLYTAARMGEPLQKVPSTSGVDCITYQPTTGLLFMCHGDRFGVVDPASGELDEILRLDRVTDFIACPGKSMHTICQNQLNSGPSWCCAGHYPFTPLCGEYDVTMRPDRGRVFCGMSARAYETPAPAAPPKQGCELGGGSWALLALLASLRRASSGGRRSASGSS